MKALSRLALVVALLFPALAQAKDGESRYAGADGVLVHYKSWGKGSAVILIHGFTLDQSFWRLQVPALAKSHRVVALDLPGHGDSGKAADTAYTMDTYAAAVEAVAQDAGVTHAALVGHSMGLPIIHTILRRGKLKVDKAVFIDGAMMVGQEAPETQAKQQAWLNGMIEGVSGPSHGLVLEQFFQGSSSKTPPRQRQALLAQARGADQHMALSTLQHLADPDVWAPARYDLPVLALYAAQSQKGVKNWLAGHYPNAKLVVWDDVDHFPQLSQPKRVNRALAAFLD